MARFSEEDIRDVVARYEATKDAALTERDARLREIHAAGWLAVELQRVTGYSRETIRQALNPQARTETNAGRRRATTERAEEPAARFVVPATLAELRGPTTGTVTVPSHLDDQGDPRYDLTKRARVARMYEAVMHRAASVNDLRDWLDQDLLIKLWPELNIAPRLRGRWERRFPLLGRRWSYRE
jgi:hypothetical protein